jgi:hypothetical protein
MSATAHSPDAVVEAVTRAAMPVASRAVTRPATTTSSPASTGRTKRTLAVPRVSQAVPSALTRGWVR